MARGAPGTANTARSTRHFPRKADAQRWLNEVTASTVTGQYVDPRAGKIIFEAYFAQWSALQVWEQTTVAAMDLAARSVTFADVPMADLRRSHLEAWVKEMRALGLAPGTIRTRVQNVRGCLRAAVRDRVIMRDPSQGLKLPRDRRRAATMQLPTAAQLAAVPAAAEPSFRAFVALAAFAGLRLGEIAGLQRGDVDFLRRRLRVQRQVQRLPGGAVEVRAPKYGSEREVFLPDGLLEVLSEHVGALPGPSSPTQWLFAGRTGSPVHQNQAGYWWRKTCARAGVSGVTLHDLRHFYASGLIAAGCDVVTVQRALGHARPTTTLNTYSHLWPTAEDRTRAGAAAIMTAVRDAAAADSLRTAGDRQAADLQ